MGIEEVESKLAWGDMEQLSAEALGELKTYKMTGIYQADAHERKDILRS